MIICRNLSEIPSLPKPIGLSIGSFDGVHLGHQALFQFLRQKVSSDGTVAALTFANHPSQLFNGHAPTLQLCTLEHKLKLFKELGIDLVILIEFNAEFAKKPFDEFLKELKQRLPFSFLALGEDARFGKDRQGKPEAVKALAPFLNFEVEYLTKTLWKDQPISSGRIRKALQEGNLAEVSALLGRAYSVFSPLSNKEGRYEVAASNLCLPPDGIYPIQIRGIELPLQSQAAVYNGTKTIRLDISINVPSISENPIEILFS
ncbi:MAG: FAD synthetase family protein [Verrucomicrobia bacterium]|nr:FAD synthetase family protein [Verrucomicrobiota bacterium]